MDIVLEHPVSSILALTALGLSAKHLLTPKTISKAPLPPSPPSKFLIGHANVLYEAYGNEEYAFYELGKKYGGIVYLNVLGMPMIVLNEARIVNELLDKRGSVFSSRPTFAIAETMGFTTQLAFLPYGQDWRIQRRIYQRYFNQAVRAHHRPIQLREARTLIRNILAQSALNEQEGKDWEPELLRFATSVVISVAFGHDMNSTDDPYLKMADEQNKKVIPAMMGADMLTAGLIQVFPLITYFPSWFPGARVPVQARRVKPYVRALYDYPFADMERKLNEGKAKESFLASQLEEWRRGEAAEDITLEHIKASSASVYSAGTETTESSLLTLLGALLLHPEVQKKAQAELDEVVGKDRLPEYEDREKLRYLGCVVEELGRWQPVAPIQPRKSMEEDVFEGMFIPKGTTVIVNARGMSLDENIYTNPFAFNPDRYMPLSEGGGGEPFFDPNFGSGRRICPGRYLAQDSIWIVAAYLLATMDILPASDMKMEEVKWKFMGTVNRPVPFRCRIVPRSGKVRELIDSEY